jgi:hypothetical protein
MNTLKIVLAVVATLFLLASPHLIVLAIWYPIGLIIYGIYKGFKGESIK